ASSSRREGMGVDSRARGPQEHRPRAPRCEAARAFYAGGARRSGAISCRQPVDEAFVLPRADGRRSFLLIDSEAEAEIPAEMAAGADAVYFYAIEPIGQRRRQRRPADTIAVVEVLRTETAGE